MKPLLFILALLVAIPVLSQEDKPIEVPQIGVKLGVSEKLDLEGITVVFKEVIEDSRCPKNVTCAWEGRAKVLVGITTNSGEEIEKTITFSNRFPVSGGVFEGKTLRFLSLTPYPDANIPVKDRAPYMLLARTVKE